MWNILRLKNCEIKILGKRVHFLKNIYFFFNIVKLFRNNYQKNIKNEVMIITIKLSIMSE